MTCGLSPREHLHKDLPFLLPPFYFHTESDSWGESGRRQSSAVGAQFKQKFVFSDLSVNRRVNVTKPTAQLGLTRSLERMEGTCNDR